MLIISDCSPWKYKFNDYPFVCEETINGNLFENESNENNKNVPAHADNTHTLAALWHNTQCYFYVYELAEGGIKGVIALLWYSIAMLRFCGIA